MKLNKKATDRRFNTDIRLAGGVGSYAATSEPFDQLKRITLTALLWENNAYIDGISTAGAIAELIPQCDPDLVADLVQKAKQVQKLRHTPLYMIREMARHKTHRHRISDLLYTCINRVDDITEFMAIYWKDGKTPIANQVKKGLALAFNKFDAYQFAKYRGRNREIKLRDVMFLVHPEPSQGKEELFKQIAEDTLPIPDTWEVSLSSGADKKETWERLISTGKLGALAFLRNLRNMHDAGVDREIVRQGFEKINPRWLLPINFYAAHQFAPHFTDEIESLMFRCLANIEKLPGYTILIVDVSGSMMAQLSMKSQFSRMDVAKAFAILTKESCERVSIYCTGGRDRHHKHATTIIPSYRGFGLSREIDHQYNTLGGGGIFTRQCLEFVKEQERETPDRIIIFSDSQDCDYPHLRIPSPFGKRNYIVDVSPHQYGVNYKGIWDAEISGWSDHFLKFIAEIEKQDN